MRVAAMDRGGPPIIGSRDLYLQGEGRLSGVSVCVVSTGDLAPDLSGQTLQNYQLLCVRTEAEALARSGAEVFLWLSSAGRLAPQALEECVWAMRSADWVTWKDTGAAPMPSLQGVAGPLGISRRVMESPDPKPGGAVRRLPWACVVGPADTHSEESIPDGTSARRYGIELDREGYWVGRFMAHLQNAGVLSLESWRDDPLGTATMLLPLTLKRRVNRWVGREAFDLSAYLRFQPGATYANGLLLEPIRYAVAGSHGRRRILLIVPHLGPGPSSRRMLELAAEVDLHECEVVVIAETANDNRWKEAWMRVSDHIFELGRLVDPVDVELAILSLAVNWEAEVVLLVASPAGYLALPRIRARLPEVQMADLVLSLSRYAVAESVSTAEIDCLDIRVAGANALAHALREMAPDGQGVRVIRDGLDLGAARVADEHHRPLTVGFLGPLTTENRADWLPSMASELGRLRAAAPTGWMVAGTGPHEIGLRNSMRRYGAQFFRDDVNLNSYFEQVDLLVVPSETADGDRAALEALGRGTAVVAVDQDGRAELISKECGVLVTGGHDGDVRLAGALADLLEDRDQLIVMGAAGRARVRDHFSREVAAQGYRGLLAALLEARTTQPGRRQLSN